MVIYVPVDAISNKKIKRKEDLQNTLIYLILTIPILHFTYSYFTTPKLTYCILQMNYHTN